MIVGAEFWDPAGFGVFDPAIENGEWHSRLAAMTNDGLVGFRRAGGRDGAEIVPDLATTLPTRTNGGRTYAFQLRKGLRYSTGAPVLAGDIRRGIERSIVHPDTNQSAVFYSSAIVGAQACLPAAEGQDWVTDPRPDCDLREGISTDDRTGTVIFHLTRPTPDFLHELALPGAVAVPQDTPVDLPASTLLPATGPYQIRSQTGMFDPASGHPRLELVRNPHFRVWSPAAQPDGYPDRVVLETGYTDNQAVERVTDGRADLLWFGATLTDLDKLRTRHGSQLHTAPRPVTNMLFLNTTTPPFDNRDARRAVAYGLDREALTSRGDFLSGRVTCQFLPPDFPGYQPYCPYTPGGDKDGKWTGPDITTAKSLVRKSGTTGAEVVVNAHDDPALRAAGKRIVALLNRLGYRATLRLREDYYPGEASRDDWNAGLAFWAASYPTASSFLPPLGSCDPYLGDLGGNPGRYCDPDIERQIATANQQQATDPTGASDAWATIDHKLVDAAATIPYGNSVNHYFVNGRVGNTNIHPITGPLIAQMWVQ
jgi:peptide/nickel transport system substrate-binding protein